MDAENYKAENFSQFCRDMTNVAENQLDKHRELYYPLCVSVWTLFEQVIQRNQFDNIMKCYENPR